MFSLVSNQNVKAMFILSLVIVIVYFPVTFLNHTLDTSLDTSRIPILDFLRDYGCSTNCIGPFNFTIDPGADGDAIWPVAKLAANLYSQGILPLWNPYLAAGTPLAADTINFAFSPMMIFHILPDSLWDIPLLISVWLAGIFTYFLLKSWKLGFLSSISGATIFMLSGPITWYLPHDSIPVIMFAPLILFSIEKTLQVKDLKYVILGSIAVALSILGGHLESISLVLLFCLTYAIFRILQITFSKHNLSLSDDSQSNGLVRIIQAKKRIISKIIIIFFGGLGLSAFFAIPVAEYVVNGVIGRDVIAGIAYSPAFTIATTFIPYFLGPIHIYAIPATSFMGSWNVLGGYVVASSLVFSLLGITFSNQLFQSSLHKRIAQFFFAISIFFMLKSIGVPIINLMGYLPVLNHVVFPRYDGFIYTLGLAISAAFGMEVIIQHKMKMKHLGTLTIISFLIVISMALLIIPYFTWNGLASYYVIFQVLQALFFILAAFLSIVAYQRNNRNASAMFLIFFLEASLYIPFGLPPIWQFYRSIVSILGIIALCTVSFLPIEKKIGSINRQNIKLVIFVIITGFTIGGQLVVYLESPQGLLLRHDAFSSTTPIAEFLKSNIDDYRMFSFDSIFRPDYQAAYEIQTLGILSAQNVNSFNSFFHNILDPYAMVTHFDYIPSWRIPNAPSLESTFLQNQKYYDFLGVKYIVSQETNPNELQTDVRGKTEFVPVGSSKESIKQTFVSPTDRINGIKIWFGTYNRINHGNLTLTLDSIPYDVNSHRISAINMETVKDGGFSQFEFAPVIDAKGKSFSLALSDPQSNENNEIAALVHGTDVDNKTLSSDLLNGQFYINGNSSKGRLTFSLLVSQEKFPLVFNHDGVNIYENKDVYPRAFLVNKFQTTDSYQNAQNIIQNPNFDLRHEIVLEKSLPIEQASLLNSSSMDDSTTNIISYTADKVKINVDVKGDSLLVLTDTYYPGWKAYVDGKESVIYRADGLVRAVFVPAGNHIVEFSYMPNSFVVGVIISIVIASSLVGFYVYSKREKCNEIKTRKYFL